MKGGVLTLAACVAGGIAAGVTVERLLAYRRGRLDVYFDDGTFVTYVEGSTEAARLLPLAQRVLAAVGESSAV